jgi:hypothetical protein
MINKKVMLFLGGIVASTANVEAINDAGHPAADAKESVYEDWRCIAVEISDNAVARGRAYENWWRIAVEITGNANVFGRMIRRILARSQPGVSAERGVRELDNSQLMFFFSTALKESGIVLFPEMMRFFDLTLVFHLRNFFIERAWVYDQEHYVF